MLLFMTLGNFSDASYSPLAPFIQNGFLLTSAEVGLITSVIFLGSMTVSFFSGILVDRLGPYTAIKFSFAVIGMGALIIFLGHSYAILIAGYFSIGFGYALITPATNSVTMTEYYPEHSPRMGIKQSGVPLGLALSAAVLPVIAINFGFKSSYFLLIVVALALAAVIPREKLQATPRSIGSGYLRDLVSAGKSRSILAVATGVIFLSWGQQTLLTFFVIFEKYNGVPILSAEVLLIILLAGSVFGRLFWAYLSDRLFLRNRVKTLSLIMAIAGLLFIMLDFRPGYYPLAIPLAFFTGMNAMGWNSTYVTVISEIAPRTKVGLFTGVSLILTGMGTIIGTPIAGIILDSTSFLEMWTVLGSSLIIMSLVFFFVGRKFVRSGYSISSPA